MIKAHIPIESCKLEQLRFYQTTVYSSRIENCLAVGKLYFVSQARLIIFK
jgi:hypothetical protein